jgi:hypothetical protein
MSGQVWFFIGFFGVYVLAGIMTAYAIRQINKGKKGW